MLTDAVLIRDILDSLSGLNLIDSQYIYYRRRRTPTIGITHNNFVWDAYSYTKTTGIAANYRDKSREGIKQTLLVLEAVISRRFESFDFDGFYERVMVLLNHGKGIRKVMPVIVYREISVEALQKARALGWLTYDITALFGGHINLIVDNLIVLKLAENTAQAEADPVSLIDDAMEIIDQSGQRLNLPNLIGDFFQSLIYQLFAQLYPNTSILQNKKYPAMDELEPHAEYYEYDLLIFSYRTNEIIAVELKGTTTNATVKLGTYQLKRTVKWFMNRTVPSLARQMKTGGQSGMQIRACYITSGKFENDAITHLNQLSQGSLKAEEINLYYDGNTLVNLASRNSLDSFKNILERYFIS